MIYMITEYFRGGDLFDLIIKNDGVRESQAKPIMKSLLEAIHFLHSNNIIHADIKPEHILLRPDDTIGFSDFSSAIHTTPDEWHSMKVGSTYYISPEMLLGFYNEKIDLWSSGIVLFTMLSGYPPFNDEVEENIFEKIKTEEVHFH
jgi:calcium-dependent protein kinase